MRDQEYVRRYADFEDWFKYTQDIAGAFYLWIVEHLFEGNELVAGTLQVGGRAVDLGQITCPVHDPGRLARPHHAARAGLRAGRPVGHGAATDPVRAGRRRPPRAVHGPRRAARPLGAAVRVARLTRCLPRARTTLAPRKGLRGRTPEGPGRTRDRRLARDRAGDLPAPARAGRNGRGGLLARQGGGGRPRPAPGRISVHQGNIGASPTASGWSPRCSAARPHRHPRQQRRHHVGPDGPADGIRRLGPGRHGQPSGAFYMSRAVLTRCSAPATAGS